MRQLAPPTFITCFQFFFNHYCCCLKPFYFTFFTLFYLLTEFFFSIIFLVLSLFFLYLPLTLPFSLSCLIFFPSTCFCITTPLSMSLPHMLQSSLLTPFQTKDLFPLRFSLPPTNTFTSTYPFEKEFLKLFQSSFFLISLPFFLIHSPFLHNIFPSLLPLLTLFFCLLLPSESPILPWYFPLYNLSAFKAP